MTANTFAKNSSWPTLVMIQFGLILRSGRWLELVIGIAALYFLAILESWTSNGTIVLSGAIMSWSVLVAAFVGLWPALVWRGEGPNRRRYHWSLPVSRGAHDLARVAAGGLWLLIVALGMSVVQFVWLDGGSNDWSVAWLAVYILGLLTGYCLSSIVAVIAGKPALWFYGVLVAWSLAIAIPSNGRVSAAIRAPLLGHYGLLAATMGSAWRLDGGDVTIMRDTPKTTVDPRSGKVIETREIELPGVPWPPLLAMASLVWLLPSIGLLLLTIPYRHER